MAFPKGHKKIGGREKGSKNKNTILLQERRDSAYEIVKSVIEFTQDEIKSKDSERIFKALEICSKYLPFVLPKLSSVDATVEIESDPITFILPKK